MCKIVLLIFVQDLIVLPSEQRPHIYPGRAARAAPVDLIPHSRPFCFATKTDGSRPPSAFDVIFVII